MELLNQLPRLSARRADAVRDEVVRLNLGLARDLAGRYRNRGIAQEDLEQVAYLGLVKAVRGFDAGRGGDFLCYAVPTILGEVRRSFRDTGWTVRPPRRIQELQAEVWAAEGDLAQTLGRSPTAADIAEHLRVDEEQVIEALASAGCFAPASLDIAVGEQADGCLADLLGGIDPEFARTETRVLLRSALGALTERDRTILDLRFVQDLTQAQIGAQIGVSQMQVSRLLTRILVELREALEQPVSTAA